MYLESSRLCYNQQSTKSSYLLWGGAMQWVETENDKLLTRISKWHHMTSWSSEPCRICQFLRVLHITNFNISRNWNVSKTCVLCPPVKKCETNLHQVQGGRRLSRAASQISNDNCWYSQRSRRKRNDMDQLSYRRVRGAVTVTSI